ncbi:hypothetical protein CVT24_002976 [Panaeolus cyanescens]|uniref:F-box domain-containing protein n=1 Tax=Panaeolus cyanescens TaxID=181874 RepID=A0A409VU37_9AGAR|nr:hypothetical protein CVT24_002976 [Panaeolus cyanescens]
MVHALDLPPDIWNYIIDNCLDAEDMIALLQTCHALHSLLSSKVTWSNKMKEAIRYEGMFAPSFDPDLMGLCDYKRALLAPGRMISKIESIQAGMEEEDVKLYPLSRRLLPFRFNSQILVMLLLPGGRYLVVKTSIETVVVDILSHKAPTDQMRQANKEKVILSSSIFLASQSQDASKFRIAVVENPGILYYAPLRIISFLGANILKLVVDTMQRAFIIFTDQTVLFYDLDKILSIKKSGYIRDLTPRWCKPLHIGSFYDPKIPAVPASSEATLFFTLNIWYYTHRSLPGFDLILWDTLLDHTYSYTYEISYDAKTGEPSIHLTQMDLIPNIIEEEIGIKHNRICAGKTVLVWERIDDARLFTIVKPTTVEDQRTTITRGDSKAMYALDLPTDIWLLILQVYLDPEDIINLLKSCRAFNSLCDDTVLWTQKLMETSTTDDTFLPKSNLDPSQLNTYKRAVLAPARMESKLIERQMAADEESSKLYPLSQRILPFTRGSPVMQLLIPGGRYLVVKTIPEITVVDVYSDDPPPEEARLRCRWQHGRASDTGIFLAAPSSDGSRIRIVLVESKIEGIITVFEFNPATSHLRELDSHQHNHRCRDPLDYSLLTNYHCETLVGDLFCYFNPSAYRVCVWNFMEDVFISWSVDPFHCDPYFPFRKILVDTVRRTFIVITDRYILLFWDLDRITSIKKSGHIPSFPPKWVKPVIFGEPTSPLSPGPAHTHRHAFFFSLNTWHHTRSLLSGFDVLVWNTSLDRTYCYTYEIHYDKDKDNEPDIRIAQLHLIPNIDGHDVGIKHNRLCAGKTILVWERYVDGRLFAVVKPTLVQDLNSKDGPPVHEYDFGTELVRYMKGDDTKKVPLGLSTFDPVSGRLCTTDRGGTSITVSDYLGDFGV